MSEVEEKLAVGPQLIEACSSDTTNGNTATLLQENNLQVEQGPGQWLPDYLTSVGLVGEGGMSIVYEVEDSRYPDKRLCVKVLKNEWATDEQAKSRFSKECSTSVKLNHARIAKALDYGLTTTGLPFIEMEYVKGRSLKELLQTESRLPQQRLVKISRGILDALLYAHSSGVIHRDLKPSNIIVLDDDEIKVIDFGIARTLQRNVTDTTMLTRTGEILGSPAYMSPEQCKGDPIDSRTDIYSLGCVMYEMLTGQNPFLADTPIKTLLRHIQDEPEPFEPGYAYLRITPELGNLVLQCLRKDREKRPTLATAARTLRNLANPCTFARASLITCTMAWSVDLIAVFLLVYGITGIVDQHLRLHHQIMGLLWLITPVLAATAETLFGITPSKFLCSLTVRTEDNRRPDFTASVAWFYCLIATFSLSILMIRLLAIVPLPPVFLMLPLCLLPLVGVQLGKQFKRTTIPCRWALPVSSGLRSHQPIAFSTAAIAIATASAVLISSQLLLAHPSFSASNEITGQGEGATASIITTKEDVYPGEKISRDMLQVRRVPLSSVPEGALDSIDKIEGAEATVFVANGNIVFDSFINRAKPESARQNK